MWKTVFSYAKLFDAIMVPVCILLALVHYFSHADVERAIFWVVLGMWFGRGQVRNA